MVPRPLPWPTAGLAKRLGAGHMLRDSIGRAAARKLVVRSFTTVAVANQRARVLRRRGGTDATTTPEAVLTAGAQSSGVPKGRAWIACAAVSSGLCTDALLATPATSPAPATTDDLRKSRLSMAAILLPVAIQSGRREARTQRTSSN